MTYTPSASNYWPPERIDHMMFLLDSGISARQISERLGISHRALLSKCSRMGVPCGRPPQEWPEERIALLRALSVTGLSATQIGDRMGMTKNSVIGKARRNGIPLKNSRAMVKAKATKIKLYDGWKPPRKVSRGLGYAVKDPAAHLPPGQSDLPSEAPTGFAVDIMGLTDRSCRWPLGEPTAEMLYCGAAKWAGSYCPYHYAKAFKPRGAPDDRHRPSA